MFRPFSGWAIIRLRLEYLIKHILECGHQERGNDLVLQCLGRYVAIYTGSGATGGVLLYIQGVVLQKGCS
jgi:hypothetical protein